MGDYTVLRHCYVSGAKNYEVRCNKCGTISLIKYTSIDNFLARQCEACKVKDRLKEVKSTKDGIKYWIKEYRKYDSIDVEFETGDIIYGTRYDRFNKGLTCPSSRNKIVPFEERLGYNGVSKDGVRFTVIKYNGPMDVIIRFEDGKELKTQWTRIHRGVVARKGLHSRGKDGGTGNKVTQDRAFKTEGKGAGSRSLASVRLGEIMVNNDGTLMKIIRYKNNNDIDVAFEDGRVLHNVKYRPFKIGQLGSCNRTGPRIIGCDKSVIGTHENIKVNEENTKTECNVNENTNAKAKEIQHCEIGLEIREQRRYTPIRVGDEYLTKRCGKIKVIEVNSSKDIKVMFYDGNTKSTTAHAIRCGTVYNNLPIVRKPGYDDTQVGTIFRITNRGECMLTKYVNDNDVNIQFRDGYVLRHVKMENLRNGKIGLQKVDNKKQERKS